jgi:phosphatidylglycerophosphatase A
MSSESQALAKLKRDVWRKPLCFIGAGFGLGMIPFAPGTFATLGGAVIVLLIWHLIWWQYLAVLLVVTIISIWLSGRIARQYQLHDPTVICLDEFAGFLLTMFLVPPTWFYLIAGFALFRLFDIWKPWIIGIIDKRMDSGFGMVLDDLVAGLFAWVLLQVVAVTHLTTLIA